MILKGACSLSGLWRMHCSPTPTRRLPSRHVFIFPNLRTLGTLLPGTLIPGAWRGRTCALSGPYRYTRDPTPPRPMSRRVLPCSTSRTNQLLRAHPCQRLCNTHESTMRTPHIPLRLKNRAMRSFSGVSLVACTERETIIDSKKPRDLSKDAPFWRTHKGDVATSTSFFCFCSLATSSQFHCTTCTQPHPTNVPLCFMENI